MESDEAQICSASGEGAIALGLDAAPGRGRAGAYGARPPVRARARLAGTWALVWGGLALMACYRPSGLFVPVESLPEGATSQYTIAPGDVLNVRVFQQESLSARVRVREDGRISLPLVNDCTAEGRTPVELAAQIQAKLKEFVNTPVVTVSLEERRPVSVSVVGEVSRAGVFTLEPGSGVVQAVAAAGGLTELAHRDGIFVLRRRPGSAAPLRIHFRWEALVRADGKASAFRLAPGDVVVVE